MLALTSALAFVLVAAPVVDDVNPAAHARVPYGTFSTLGSAPTKEWVRTLTSTYSVGVTPVQDTLMWVSAGQSEMKIYIYNIKDPARPLIDSFAQTGGPSGWGIRDMAWKASTDEVFAGYDNQRFNVYDAQTHAVKHQYTVSGYSGTVRGMGYSALQESCWTCNFDSAPMTKFSITGANGHQVRSAADMASAYGIAVDEHQHCFWVTQAGAIGASPTLKVDFSYDVVDSFNAEGWEQGGGCEMWKDTFLLQLSQGSPDKVFCMRFGIPPLYDHDVKLNMIVVPPGNINPGSCKPKARVMNFGSNSESDIPVFCWIDSAGVRVYSASATLVGPVGPGMEADISFAPNWDTGPVGSQYGVTMFTALTGDEDAHNDTLTGVTTVAGALFADTVHVRPVDASAPVIDGFIAAGEWSASTAYDVSDLLGRGGAPQPAGSCVAYFLYDSGAVYVALDCPNRLTRVSLDQFGPYVDENNDGGWSADSSEGGYAIEYAEPDDDVVYRAVLDTLGSIWELGVFQDSLSASSLASGHLQFEAELPIGTQKYQLAVGSGDTAGCFLYAALDGLSDYIGWWPQAVSVSQWPNPRYYGAVVFDSLPSGASEGRPGVQFALYRASPSIVRDQAYINYFVAVRGNVSLGVYDVTGKLVKTLASGLVTPGVRTAIWDRTDNTGRRVANGAYFYRLAVDGRSVSSKATVLK